MRSVIRQKRVPEPFPPPDPSVKSGVPTLYLSKRGTFSAGSPGLLKFKAACSCPLGCCSLHKTSKSAGHSVITAIVRCTLA